MRLFKRNHSTAREPDWYQTALPERRREYDAFGPWTYEIKNEADMPPCFLPWFKDLAGARIMIKIPINKERRQARPGENLYRAILAVFDDQIRYLSQEDGRVESRVIRLSAMQALRNYVSLLWGEMTIFAAEGEVFAAQYNAVSTFLMDGVLSLLRSLIAGDSPEILGAANLEIPEVKNYYFNNLIRGFKARHPQSRLVHCEEPGVRCTDGRGRRRVSLGLIVLETDSELVFINRGNDFKRSWEAWHATSHTVFPKSRLQSYTLSVPGEDFPAAGHEFILRLSSHDFRYRLFGNPGKLAAALDALGLVRNEESV